MNLSNMLKVNTVGNVVKLVGISIDIKHKNSIDM
jgi:hypothetical protein